MHMNKSVKIFTTIMLRSKYSFFEHVSWNYGRRPIRSSKSLHMGH